MTPFEIGLIGFGFLGAVVFWLSPIPETLGDKLENYLDNRSKKS